MSRLGIRNAGRALQVTDHGIASEIANQTREIEVYLSGATVGSWLAEHDEDDLHRCGFYLIGGGPQLTVRVVDRRGVGPTFLGGELRLGLYSDGGEFVNSFEAAQVAIEKLAQLPDAERLAGSSIAIEVKIR